MSNTRIPAIAGWATLAVVVLGAGLWAWQPWTEDAPWVPTCADLAKSLPAAAGGTWSVSEADLARGTTESSTRCELAFTSADQRFSGTLRVSIYGEPDADLLRQRAADEPCEGTAEPKELPKGYVAFRACSGTLGDFAHASVVAAKDSRWLRMTASTSIRPDNRTDVFTFSREVVRKAVDQGLTLRESK